MTAGREPCQHGKSLGCVLAEGHRGRCNQGKVWINVSDWQPRCPLCGHRPVMHDGEACSVEVGYDHINGSHECGCPLTRPARKMT